MILALLLLNAFALCAQDATVVATAGGKKYTAADVERIIQSMPPREQAFFRKHPKEGLEGWLSLTRLVEQAEKDILHEQSPYKEAIAYSRLLVLYEALIEETSKKIHAPAAEKEQKLKEWFESHRKAIGFKVENEAFFKQ